MTFVGILVGVLFLLLLAGLYSCVVYIVYKLITGI
jgi:hypothetical protein